YCGHRHALGKCVTCLRIKHEYPKAMGINVRVSSMHIRDAAWWPQACFGARVSYFCLPCSNIRDAAWWPQTWSYGERHMPAYHVRIYETRHGNRRHGLGVTCLRIKCEYFRDTALSPKAWSWMDLNQSQKALGQISYFDGRACYTADPLIVT
ncbi:hypothetical protein J6590_034985, partial [Homalodisca vitripennis]